MEATPRPRAPGAGHFGNLIHRIDADDSRSRRSVSPPCFRCRRGRRDRRRFSTRHLHYNAEATAAYPVADVLRRFRDAGVATIIATSRPNEGTRALVAAAAADPAAAPRMVPFIRPYRTEADRQTWFNDPDIYALIESERVRDVGWRGIGEFHLFGRDADTPWARKVVTLAAERELWLHAHCDDAALEILFAHDPRSGSFGP